ncbi:MAG: TonB-dependent receptor plug domain-containing protein [Gemmatimonadota bacterium]
MIPQLVRTVAGFGLFLAAIVFGAGALSAQQTGVVTGQVTAEATGRPLGGAQVAFEDLNIGMLTNNNGGFLVQSVPVGTHEITVRFIGYGTVRQQVNVEAGQTSEVDIALASAAIGLDEIVVTGTGAPTERRRLGQTINSIDASELELAPITSVSEALLGRVPGMAGAIGNRETGQASLPVFRGLTSLSQRNTPIIYIDGIRMNNSEFNSAGLVVDQLSQISPSDIERIEVIKGAAAATLFGTEASSGVIQIFTKRGQTGAPSYTFQTDQQAIQMKLGNFPPNAGYDPATGQILVEDVAKQYVNLGHHQNYTMSIRGGTPSTTYYVSGRLMDEVGAMPNNELMNASLRATLDFNHTDKLSSSIDANILRNTLEAPNPSWGSLASEMMLGNPVNATPQRPHGEQDFTVQGTLKDRDQAWTTTQMLAGGANYQFTENLVAQAKVGHHRADRRRERMRPEGEVIGLAGIRQIWGDEITHHARGLRRLGRGHHRPHRLEPGHRRTALW